MRLKMLIWKDFRQQRRFLFSSLLMLLVPHFIATAIFAVTQFGEQRAAVTWLDCLRIASMADLFIGVLLFGFFPANAIAGERADRSAGFFAYLPIRRIDAVVSKAAVSLALSTAVMGTCIALTYLSLQVQPREPGPSWDESYVFFATLVAMFGVAWMVSSFASLATYAAAAGVAVPICFGVTLGLLLEQQGISETRIGGIYVVLCLVIGLGGFAVGVWHYLRRVGS